MLSDGKWQLMMNSFIKLNMTNIIPQFFKSFHGFSRSTAYEFVTDGPDFHKSRLIAKQLIGLHKTQRMRTNFLIS